MKKPIRPRRAGSRGRIAGLARLAWQISVAVAVFALVATVIGDPQWQLARAQRAGRGIASGLGVSFGRVRVEWLEACDYKHGAGTDSCSCRQASSLC